MSNLEITTKLIMVMIGAIMFACVLLIFRNWPRIKEGIRMNRLIKKLNKERAEYEGTI